MRIMKLYVVDHFVDFLRSEYGGLWVVIAENDNECFDLIVEYDNDMNSEYYINLREKVVNARTYVLADELESTVVESFTT